MKDELSTLKKKCTQKERRKFYGKAKEKESKT